MFVRESLRIQFLLDSILLFEMVFNLNNPNDIIIYLIYLLSKSY